MTLVIDTTTDLCEVAVFEAATCLSTKARLSTHQDPVSGFLPSLIDDVLLSPHALTHILVACGPGSFTGIRIGIAMALGLSHALGVPCGGLTLFDTVRECHPGPLPLLIVRDTKCRTFYGAFYEENGNATQGVIVPDHPWFSQAETLIDTDKAPLPLKELGPLVHRLVAAGDLPAPHAFYLKAPLLSEPRQ